MCNLIVATKTDTGGVLRMNNCIFCKIITGEIPSSTVYEDDNFKAIMDIFPAAKGHVIILPKKHYANLFELEEEVAAKALAVAKKIAIAVKEETNCDGINILQNNGIAAGQTVYHFHIHVIPRYENDKVQITWGQGSYEEGEAADMAASIAGRIS
jgi:Diadenosine tetraphosphate (Ap4A) hydrolase and other HIT family hydrolases